jgi:hypothetical protein
MPIHLRRWLQRNRRTLSAAIERRAVTAGGELAWVMNVAAQLSNSPLNATHFAASRRLHTAASGAPLLARALAWRWTDG